MTTPHPPSQLPVTQAMSVDAFLKATTQREDRNDSFCLETPSMLELNMKSSKIFAKAGSMVATMGPLNYSREGMFEHGLAHFLKKFFTGEGASLMKIEGSGRAYLADKARRIQLLNLNNQAVTVNGNDLLAFESSLQYSIKMVKRIGAMLSAGLFNVELRGQGVIALCSHGQPLTLKVNRGIPLYTDPGATIAWSSNLQPDFSVHTNVTSVLLGRGSGESVRMKFEGEGWVIIQPYEETPVRTR